MLAAKSTAKRRILVPTRLAVLARLNCSTSRDGDLQLFASDLFGPDLKTGSQKLSPVSARQRTHVDVRPHATLVQKLAAKLDGFADADAWPF